MKCKNCKHYEPCNKFDDDVKPIKNKFERFGECKCKNHIIGDPTDYGVSRFNLCPFKSGFIATNGVFEYMTYTEFYVDKNFGCINFKKKHRGKK
jgi:hypothetical protein